MALPREKTCTIEDIYALPEGRRAELINGQIYDMAPPSTMQTMLNRISVSYVIKASWTTVDTMVLRIGL